MSQPMSFGSAGLIFGVIVRDRPVVSKYIDLDFDGACLDSCKRVPGVAPGTSSLGVAPSTDCLVGSRSRQQALTPHAVAPVRESAAIESHDTVPLFVSAITVIVWTL